MIHTVKDFGIVNKAEVDVFLELSCFYHDPVDVGNLISGSSAFSKTSLNIWKFTVHVLLKPGLENFEHVRWVQLCSSLSILWHFLSLGLEWKLTFSSPVASLRKALLSPFANLWNSAFRWVYHSLSPLPFASLLFSAICKSSSDNHFDFLHFFFSGYKFVQRRGKNVTLVVCFLMQLKREIKKCLKLADYFILLETPGLLACYPLTSNFTCWNPKLHSTSECDCIWRWHL